MTALLIYFLVNREMRQKNQLIEFLNKSEHWYNVVVSNIPNVDIYLFDPDGRLILSQGSVLISQGVDVYNLRGKRLNETNLTQKTKDFVIPRLDSVLRGNEVEDVYQFKKSFYQIKGVALYDEKKKVFAGLLVISDVTEEHKLIKKLRDNSEEFERLYKKYYQQNSQLTEKNISLHELNDRYKSAKRRAEESDRLKTSFLANMSHEIRTPLNAIIGFSQLMGADVLSKDEVDEYSHIIAQSGESLLLIIEDILIMSQLDAGQYEVRPKHVSLEEVWNEIQFSATEYISRKSNSHKLKLKVDESILSDRILTDTSILVSVIRRLLDNALKFSEEFSTVGIDLGLNSTDDLLEIAVTDSGCGIPKEKLEEIFIRFAQIRGSHLQPVDGNGLGLSIVKGLVDAMHAKIHVESEPGKGSVFTLKIPFRNSSKKQKPHIMSELDLRKKAGKMLVVEDVKDNFILLRAYLRNFEIEIYHVANAASALKFVEENSDIDLIMMDIRLPDDNGASLTKKMRERGVSCPIIAQTAYADSQDKHMCLKAGCSDYLSKPIHKQQFLDTIGNYVELVEKS
jgi:signal transduction histidine kinase/CheY-like chemotaxis protein